MDDGARDVDMALRMLWALRRQGVHTVALTPHFDVQQEDPEAFIHRRRAAHAALAPRIRPGGAPRILLGAEIRLTPGLSRYPLRQLCLTGSDLLLIELPDRPFQRWMLEELENVTYSLRVTPVLAHVERYLPLYTKDNYAALLSFAPAVCQVSTDSFGDRHALRLIKQLADDGRMVLPGSDCHNLTTRPPNFSELARLNEKRGVRDYLAYIQQCAQYMLRTHFRRPAAR